MRNTPTTAKLVLCLLAAALAAACASPAAPPATAPAPAPAPASAVRLDPETLPAWSHYLAPRSSELAWESLPWLTSYSDGVLAAQEQRRPLLLWVMNGHPLGCT